LGGLTDLPLLAASISGELDRAGIPHAISGAAAMAAHGYVRATQDLDVLVVTTATRLPEVFALIRDQGFAGEDRELLESLRDRFVAELTRGPVRVEVLVPAIPYHRTLTDRAVRIDVGGRELPFVSIEDLVVLKLLWRRAKDVPDVQALLSLAGASFDTGYARATLGSILPDTDPRHAEFEALVKRFAGPAEG
jgi:hypothetical protein